MLYGWLCVSLLVCLGSRVCCILCGLRQLVEHIQSIFFCAFSLFIAATFRVKAENALRGKTQLSVEKHSVRKNRLKGESASERVSAHWTEWKLSISCWVRCALSLSLLLSARFALLPALFECISSRACCVAATPITWPLFVRLSRCLRLLSLWLCLFLSRLKRFRKSCWSPLFN